MTRSPAGAGLVSGQSWDPQRRIWGGAIDCGTTCTAPMATVAVCTRPDQDPCPEIEPQARLRAEAVNGWALERWSGCAPSPDGYCYVDGDDVHAVVATFVDAEAPTLHNLSATQDKTGAVTVAADATDNDGAPRIALRVDDGPPIQVARLPHSFPARALATGRRTITARAYDARGNESVASVTVDVDSTPPQIAMTSGPGVNPGSSARDAFFEFRVQEPHLVSVQCGLDRNPPGACTGQFQSHHLQALADGVHTLQLVATDAYGNRSSHRHPFRIDTTPPDTTIGAGPGDGSKTSDRSARLEFTGPADVARFECSLDGSRFAACTSPASYANLAVGTHSFRVRAIDRVGHAERVPARRTWTVVRDGDGDGVDRGRDCDDTDPGTHPGALDVPENGRDEDCDGVDALILDRDGDGFTRAQDCDDANARVNPAAADVPGNDADEDCDGTPAPWPRLRTQIRMVVEYAGRHSRVTRLDLTDAVRGTAVTVTCAGRGCPFKSKRVTVKKDGRTALTRLFKGRRLAPGVRIDISVRHADAITPWVRFETRAGAVPKRTERCLSPGVRRPGRC